MQDPGAMAAPGRALAQLGGAVADIGTDFLQKYAEARQQADAAGRVAKASRALSEQEDIYSKADDSIAAGKGYGEAAAKIKAEALKDVTDLRVSNYVGQRIDTETLTRGESVRRQSFGNESSNARGNLEKQLGQYGFQAATGSSPEIRSLAHDNAMAAIKGASASGYITGEKAAAYGLNFNEGAAIGRVRFHMNEALTTEDPELAAYRANALAQDMQKNPEHYEDISAERFGTLADEAARMAHTLQDRYENSLEASDAINRRHTVEAARDNINSLGATGLPIPGAPTDQQIKEALPKDPVEAEKLIGLTTMAQNGYDASQAMKWTTPAEDNAQAEAFAAKPGILAEQQAQQYNAWVNAQNKKYNALREDPASYVLGNSPETRQAMENAKTPEQMKAALAAQDGLYDRLEVPSDRRAVLTKAQAERSVAQLLDKPENAPAVLDGQQKLFGDRWPRVFQDLTALGKLPPAMQAVGNLMDGKEPTRDAVILARWIAQTKDRQVDDLIGSTAKSDIDRNIVANEDVQRFNRSMSLQGLANTQIAGINDGIVALAYAKRFQDQDASAAEHAAAAFLDKYQFLGAARIPRENYDAVSRAAAATLNTLTPDRIQIPRAYGGDALPSTPVVADPATVMPGVLHLNEKIAPKVPAGAPRPLAPGEWIDNPPKGTDKQGSWSSEITNTVQAGQEPRLNNGRATVLPGMWIVNGKPVHVDEDTAVEYALRSGLKFKSYNSNQEAEKASQDREDAWQKIAPKDAGQVAPLWEPGARAASVSGPSGPPERFLELVQDSSLWINNPRADGLRLMDIDGKLVRTKDGKPLEIPFTVTPPPRPAYGNPGKFDPINLPAGGAP
jgi:hypothetical protein